MAYNGKNKERMINEKKLKDRLMQSVEFAKENGEYNDQASWPYQQGVLLDYKEAEYICSLLGVVGQSEQLVCECGNPSHWTEGNTDKCWDCGNPIKAN